MRSDFPYSMVWMIIGATIFVLACSNKTTETAKKTTGRVHRVTIDAESKANMGTPVALDIVSAYDRQLVEALDSIDASDWFASKSKYIDQFEGKIFVMGREIAAGNQVQIEYTTEIDAKPISTFIFAAYRSPGEHRVKVEGFEPLIIKLEENEIVVSD